MSRIATLFSLPSRSKNSAPGCPFTSSRREVKPKRARARSPAISKRATLARPWTARAAAGALPPPSPRKTTSWASSSSSPWRSPSSAAAKKRLASCSRCSREASNRGRRSSTWAAGPCGELAGVLLARPDDLRDPVVGLVEHLVQQERGALLGRQALEQDEEGERQRVRDLDLAGGILIGARHERLRQPLAHIGLAPDPRRVEVVEREPRDHRRQVGARRLDPLAALARPVEAEEPLLHHVLRLAHAAEHPVGDGERRPAQLVELLLGHRSAESLREALPPARVARLPAELALGLLVRGSAHLGHHDRRHLTARQPPQPAWNTPRWLGTQRARQHRQPLPHRRGLVVDDVVDTRLAALDCNRGRRRGVFDVDVRP